jgi:hypothetical protein
MDAPLVLKDFGGVIEVTPHATELKHNALALAGAVRTVTTPEEQLQAVKALSELKVVRSGIEQTRKAVKAPVLELGRRIDRVAANFVDEIERQYGRLSGLINHYQKKLLRDKAEKEKSIEKQSGYATELRRKAATCRAAGDDKAAEEFERQAFDLEMAAEVAVVPTMDKPKGLVVRQKINFQVLDAIVFCQAYPQFWKWHEDNETLKLDRMRVLDELNREGGGLFHRTRFPEELPGSDGELVQPAGLRVYEETKAHVR